MRQHTIVNGVKMWRQIRSDKTICRRMKECDKLLVHGDLWYDTWVLKPMLFPAPVKKNARRQCRR